MLSKIDICAGILRQYAKSGFETYFFEEGRQKSQV